VQLVCLFDGGARWRAVVMSVMNTRVLQPRSYWLLHAVWLDSSWWCCCVWLDSSWWCCCVWLDSSWWCCCVWLDSSWWCCCVCVESGSSYCCVLLLGTNCTFCVCCGQCNCVAECVRLGTLCGSDLWATYRRYKVRGTVGVHWTGHVRLVGGTELQI